MGRVADCRWARIKLFICIFFALRHELDGKGGINFVFIFFKFLGLLEKSMFYFIMDYIYIL